MTRTQKELSNADLIELVDERRRAGEIIIDCLHDKNGTWFMIREKAEMSGEEAEKIAQEWEKKAKGETLADRFLRKNGIEKDKDGTPDIVGKVMGDYGNWLKNSKKNDGK